MGRPSKDGAFKPEDLRLAALKLGPKPSNDQLVALPPEILDALQGPRPTDEELSRMLHWATNEIKRLRDAAKWSFIMRARAKKGGPP